MVNGVHFKNSPQMVGLLPCFFVVVLLCQDTQTSLDPELAPLVNAWYTQIFSNNIRKMNVDIKWHKEEPLVTKLRPDDD